jgi:hypothetical protein
MSFSESSRSRSGLFACGDTGGGDVVRGAC